MDWIAEVGFVIVFYLAYILVLVAVSVGTYVLRSLGMYTIAKRRGIRNPWLAWVPLGCSWILGCISDQYRYVVRAQVKNKRSWLLAIEIMTTILVIAFYVLFGAVIVQAAGLGYGEFDGIVGSFAGMLGVVFVMGGLAIALAVLQYMALYDLFYSCEPSNGALYLILSMFISITQPILLFVCRNKDGGMPPRRPEYMPEPEPIREPWENKN